MFFWVFSTTAGYTQIAAAKAVAADPNGVFEACAGAKRASEACAAWVSANAAAESAALSWWQLLIGVGGLMGLLYSLHLTRRATNAAIDATKDTEKTVAIAERNADAAAQMVAVARENARTELRAYLDVRKVHLIGDKARDGENDKCAAVRVEVHNFGRTPATDVSLKYEIFLVEKLGDARRSLHHNTLVIGMISPSDFCGASFWFRMANDDWTCVWAKQRFLEVAVGINFADVHGHEHELVMEFESTKPDHFSVIEGTRKVLSRPCP